MALSYSILWFLNFGIRGRSGDINYICDDVCWFEKRSCNRQFDICERRVTPTLMFRQAKRRRNISGVASRPERKRVTDMNCRLQWRFDNCKPHRCNNIAPSPTDNLVERNHSICSEIVLAPLEKVVYNGVVTIHSVLHRLSYKMLCIYLSFLKG